MNIGQRKEYVISHIKADIDSGEFTLRSIFIRYLPEIEILKQNGICYTRFYKMADLGISLKHFQDLIRHAKAKQQVQPPSAKKAALAPCLQPEVNATTPQATASEWRLIFSDIPDRLIADLTTAGLTPEQVRVLIRAGTLNNTRELRHYLNEIIRQKHIV
ncbi:hypothetical protein [Vibrio aerogenes]|uniref:hypothetical protein n=1 Tax=Vibrio aerogenes TaxID=92172 RepID=UPI0021C30826|nr:hypothetical protein [Vibrio aerogenes]